MRVYIVTGETAYEGSDVLRVFADEDKAKRFAARCQKYQDGRPDVLEVIDIEPSEDNDWLGDERPATLAEQMERLAEIDAWEAKHPAGRCYYDHYCVSEHEVTP